METHENYIGFETAKRLKELGFDWITTHFWYVKSKRLSFGSYNNYNGADDYLSAPTLEQAARWLRDEKKIIPYVNPTTDYSEDHSLEFQASICDMRDGSPLWSANLPMEGLGGTSLDKSWEDALEEAVERSLDLLEKGDKDER